MHANTFFIRQISACIITGLIFVSGTYLFMKNDRELDPHYQKNWWILAFEHINTSGHNDFDFIITNHTASDTFLYEMSNESGILLTRVETIPQGTSKTIHPEYEPDQADSITIKAWPTDRPKMAYSIYRKH